MDFFIGTFGFRESRDSVYSNIEVNKTDEGNIVYDKVNGKKWNSGIFQVLNFDQIPKHPKRGGGKLHIIRGNGSKAANFYLVDVLSSQGHPSNDGATYLAASNFNALEFVSSGQTAANGISGYPYDRTQGPYCAIACGPSILYRNYFVSVPGSRSIGQFSKEINLLEDTPIKVVHGYAKISKSDSKDLQKSGFDFTNLSKYKVASHKNCQVTMTQKDGQFVAVEPENGKQPQIAHHVYAAAFNLNGDVCVDNFTIKITESLIYAQYRNTILCAWDNSIQYPGREGSNKLYLTILGGGVFGNPIELICEQIVKCKDLIVDSGLDVYVVCFNNWVYSKVYPILKGVINSTGGSIVE